MRYRIVIFLFGQPTGEKSQADERRIVDCCTPATMAIAIRSSRLIAHSRQKSLNRLGAGAAYITLLVI
jgi:hypothetical protein